MQSLKPRKLKKPHLLALGRMLKHAGRTGGNARLKRVGRQAIQAAAALFKPNHMAKLVRTLADEAGLPSHVHARLVPPRRHDRT
jgi:hypothetical protein